MLKKKVFIIAEAGVNHNGCLKIAKKLVDVAVKAKCDAVKFQTFKAENLLTKDVRMAGYQQKQVKNLKIKTQFDLIKSLELSYQDFDSLKAYCQKSKIMFLSTPFDTESADFLDSLKMKLFKVSSGDLTNIPFLKYLAMKKKPIILSTGMGNIPEIKEAVFAIKKKRNYNISLLHCVTDYPASMKDLNLKVIPSLLKQFKISVGFSDHSLGIGASIAAVALGAEIIEKHFTLSRDFQGPDHKASLEPQELKALVATIRNIENALGDGLKRRTAVEKQYVQLVRKSVVSSRDIPAGKRIAIDDLLIKRPGTGIQPKEMGKILKRRAKKNILGDSVLQWEDIA